MSLQHFVPRFVLSQFKAPGSGEKQRHKQIVALDLSTKSVYQASLTKVAASHGFYDFVNRAGDSVSIDPFLSDLEHVTAPAWQKLARCERVQDLNQREREALALFIVTLAYRGPSTRAEIEAIPRLMLERFRQEGEDTSQIVEWIRGSKNDDVDIHASSIVHVAGHYGLLASRTWLLFRPPEGRRFCTSDAPVMRFNEIGDGVRGNLGLMSPGICFQVAVTPRLLLLIADGKPYGVREIHEVVEAHEQNFLHYNWLLARSAYRCLYATSRLDFAGVPDGAWTPEPNVAIA